jgi:hypothetical protein
MVMTCHTLPYSPTTRFLVNTEPRSNQSGRGELRSDRRSPFPLLLSAEGCQAKLGNRRRRRLRLGGGMGVAATESARKETARLAAMNDSEHARSPAASRGGESRR